MKHIHTLLSCAAVAAGLLSGIEAGASVPDRSKLIDSLWTTGIDHTHHGRFEQSNAVFEQLLQKRGLPKKMRKAVYDRLAINADLSGDYLSQYQYLVLRDGRKGQAGDLVTAKQMSELPRHTIEKPDSDVVINYILDSLYYEGKFAGCEIRIPVTIGGKKENVILDNGCAKFCVASETFAKDHGIRPIGAEGNAVGVVETVSMWFGLCDSLSIGGLVFKNLIFVVIPDEFIDNSILEVNAMLGASVFRLAGEMVFDNKARTVLFPIDIEERESNVTIDDNGTHFITAVADGDSLTLQLDLGAAKTSLNANYYLKFEEKVKATCEEKTSHVGGVGGMKEVTVYSAPELSISSCGGCFVKKDLEISTERNNNEENEDGSVGNDFLLSFDKATLNLRDMYLYVE